MLANALPYQAASPSYPPGNAASQLPVSMYALPGQPDPDVTTNTVQPIVDQPAVAPPIVGPAVAAARALAPKGRQSRWYTPLFSCTDDVNACLASFFCAPCLIGQMYHMKERLHRGMDLFRLCEALALPCVAICELRNAYNSDGCMKECCINWCCTPCAISQYHREMTLTDMYPGVLWCDAPYTAPQTRKEWMMSTDANGVQRRVALIDFSVTRVLDQDWSTSIFGCCEDPASAIEILMCPHCHASLKQRLDGEYKVDCELCFFMVLCPHNLTGVVRARRQAARRLDRANEGDCELHVLALYCPQLSLCQTYRVDRRHGEFRGGFCCISNHNAPAVAYSTPAQAAGAVLVPCSTPPAPGTQKMQ